MATISKSGFSAETVNPAVLKAEYAVRGEVPARAAALEQQLQERPGSLPFDKVVKCNIGNPQSLGQKPITFSRQVLSLVMNPELINIVGKAYKSDVIERAKAYIGAVPSVGAYTDSQGVPLVRSEVARFIEERDCFPKGTISPGNIFLTDGASSGVKVLMQAMIRNENDCVLIPIPQYPLYSATTSLLNGSFSGYYLDEADNWQASMTEMQRALDEARARGKCVRGLVVINPGNPTGQSLPAESLRQMMRFCHREGLVFMADEVYQENVYGDAPPFYSARRAVADLAAEVAGVQVASFHSTSKGFVGECGLRGGYFELHGFDAGVKEQLTKLVSVCLCSNVPGQFTTGLMVNPPRPGSPSYEQYKSERDGILASLHRRAGRVVQALRSLEGVSCNEAQGAMYLFPQVRLPQAAVEAAKKAGKAPDALYCLQLLDATGLVVVPGSGFGQVDGTYHFRTTFLPSETDIDAVMQRLAVFHKAFMLKYAGTTSKL